MELRRRRLITERARQLLLESRITKPPVPVEEIAAKLAIPVVREPLPNQDVSGFYLRQGDIQVIGVNSAHPYVRQRFTIGHEIGHAVLTAHDHLYVDRIARLRDARSSDGTDLGEIEANAFAAELLMPKEFIDAEFRKRGGLDMFDQDDVRQLADVFEVSTQALLIRLGSLGIQLIADWPL